MLIGELCTTWDIFISFISWTVCFCMQSFITREDAMRRKIIELKGITKAYDGEKVLDHINLDIYDNEFVTLLGPSGCGKTTTLRIIAGFEQPDEGDVLFLGENIASLPPYKRNVNTVFQRYALFPHLNVFENIAFPLRVKKVPNAEIIGVSHRDAPPGGAARF